MKQRFFINIISIFAVLLYSNCAFAQGGSNYSIFGLGDIVLGQTASSQALGGTQVAYPSDNTINMLNPALWAKVKTTRIQTGYKFNQNIIDNGHSSLWQNNGLINGFYSIFNFDTLKEISASLMYQPFSSVNYYITTPIYENNNVIGSKTYKGSGGINLLTLGLGSKIIEGLYLGASVSASIGKIAHNSYSTFTNTYSTDYHINNINTFSGANYSVGIFYNPISTLGIGMFYKLSPKGNVENNYEYLYNPQTAYHLDTAVVYQNKLKMPDFFGIGASYTMNRLMLSMDYLYGDFSEINIYNAGQAAFGNLIKYSFGVTFLGNPNKFASLTDRISYKLGTYYQQQYYSLNNNSINEYGVAGGLQFPISQTAQIDLSITVGKHGTLNNGLLSETFGKIIVDVSIGDSWFKPIRYEY